MTHKTPCGILGVSVGDSQLDCSHLRGEPLSVSSAGIESFDRNVIVSKVDVVSGLPPQIIPKEKTKGRELKQIRRVPQSSSIILPTVLNINPRSLYGRQNSLAGVVEEYEGEIVTVSESWNREQNPLVDLIEIENFEIFMNAKQRTQRGGKPLILVNTKKYSVMT